MSKPQKPQRVPTTGSSWARDPLGLRLEIPDPSLIELALLGRFEFRVGGRPWKLSQRCETLLSFLALAANPVDRSTIAGRVWPDKSEERANANLRTTVWRLNKTPTPVLDASGRKLSLHQQVWVDVYAVSHWADRLIDGAPTAADLKAVLTQDVFNLLPEMGDDWLVVERERLRQRVLHSVDRLVELLCHAGEYARALDVGLSALAQDPLRESTNLAVMSVHLAEGNRSEAVRVYERCSALLWAELGVQPSHEMRQMARRACAD